MPTETFDLAMYHFGRIVADERRRQGITQEGLAELADLHRNAVCKIERGRDDLLFDTITNVCLALGIQRIGIDFSRQTLDCSFSGQGVGPVNDGKLYLKIGMMLETLRREHDLSRERLSHAVGIHRNTICRIESGSTEIRVSTLLALYRHFGISEVRTIPAELLPAGGEVKYGVTFLPERRKEGFQVMITVP